MGTDGVDVLTFGPSEQTPSRTTPRLMVLVAACLLAGYLVGNRGPEPVGPVAQESDPVDALVAGVVRERHPIEDDLAFDIVLSNGSSVPLAVTVRTLGPVRVRHAERQSLVPAHASRTVSVTVPTTCPGKSGSFSELTADVTTTAGRRRAVLPVVEAGDFAAYLTALCARPTTESRASIEGVWAQDRAFTQARRDGSALLWFRPGGGFAADDEGRLFTGDPATEGSYVVRGSRLRIVARDGHPCAQGQQTVWELRRRSATSIALRYVSGDCPREPGGVWVLRRVLSTVPAGVTW